MTQVKGAELANANLDSANGQGGFFARANLSGATMRWALLLAADFREAELTGADIRGSMLGTAKMMTADLLYARLEDAWLYGADLTGACLVSSRMKSANLPKAKLTGANLIGADLRNAGIEGADLKGALLFRTDLRGAKGLSPEQVREAIGWEYAYYSREALKSLGLPDDHNKRLGLQEDDISDRRDVISDRSLRERSWADQHRAYEEFIRHAGRPLRFCDPGI